MTQARIASQLWLAYAALVAVGLWLRPLVPVDETRYLAVAWEMWEHGNWLFPHLNGEPYTHKPPLLFWLIHAGWAVFGVNAWWPRLMGPLMTALCLFLLQRLAARLWPRQPAAHFLAPVIFLGTWYLAIYSAGVMFDMLLLAWILLAWLALWRAASERSDSAMLAFGVCIGFALLSKGPVALVYTLPLALAVRWWSPNAYRWRGGAWYGRILLIHVFAFAIPMGWLAALAHSAGDTFLHQVLWEQTADRVVGAIGHGRPWWWYLPLLPALALPWLLWPPAWRAFRKLRAVLPEPGAHFVATAFLAAFLVLSATGGKQVHYLVPLLALAALLLARLLAEVDLAPRRVDQLLLASLMSPLPLLFVILAAPRLGVKNAAWLSEVSPAWVAIAVLPTILLLAPRAPGAVAAAGRIAIASVMYLAIVCGLVFGAVRPRYDLQAAGEFVGAEQRAGHPVAYVGGRYQGEFGFHGRLREPVRLLRAREVPAWLAAHPSGLLVMRTKRLQAQAVVAPLFSQPYKTGTLVMLRAADVRAADMRFVD